MLFNYSCWLLILNIQRIKRMPYTSKTLWLLITIAFSLSCKNEKEHITTTDLCFINLAKGIKEPVENLLLSDLATDIEIIPLETSNNSIFNYENIKNIISTEHSLLIGTGNRILHFDRQGKYIGDIGNFGEGPQDFYYTRGLGYNEITQEVYVPSNFGTTNELKIYHLKDGRFLGKIKIAPNGISLIANKNNGEAKEYCFIDGMHFVRRKLPLPNPEEEPWQIMIKNIKNEIVSYIYDPVTLKNIEQVTKMSGSDIIKAGTFWGSDTPILNRYNGNRSILFEGNDTVYHIASDGTLCMRFLMNSRNKLSDKEIHQLNKAPQYFNQGLIVKDFLETNHYIYLVVENEEYSYLLQFDKVSGDTRSLRKKGRLEHSNLMDIHYRIATSPKFINDLCGGPSFYPTFHNDYEWIDFYTPDEIISSIESVKQQKVLYNNKKEQLLQLIETVNSYDNPIVFILKLK